MSFHALAPESKQKAVYRKYSNPKLSAVSLYSPAKKLLSILSLFSLQGVWIDPLAKSLRPLNQTVDRIGLTPKWRGVAGS